jgi:hypothetical protein
MSDDEFDPRFVSSQQDFAALLSRVRFRAGNPSLRDLERWVKKQHEAGRRVPPLPHTTVADVLAGRRLPSSALLATFLEACGIVGAAQQRWMETRNRLEEHKFGLVPSAAQPLPESDEQSLDELGDSRGTDRKSAVLSVPAPARYGFLASRRRLLIGTGGAALAVGLAIFIGLNRQNGSPATDVSGTPSSAPPLSAPSSGPPLSFVTTLGCVPDTCAVAATELPLSGQVSGDPPSGFDPLILIRVESTGRWYLGPTVVPAPNGTWSRKVAIGNPVPQPKDRQFTICAFLLPSVSVDGLAQRQVFYRGDGLPVEELPPSRTELVCVPAVRLANS